MPLLDARWWEINLGLSFKMEFGKSEFQNFSEKFPKIIGQMILRINMVRLSIYVEILGTLFEN